jgi:hypothetical protein
MIVMPAIVAAIHFSSARRCKSRIRKFLMRSNRLRFCG